MANPWVEHIKKFAKDRNISYWEAIKMPECKETYKKPSKSVVSKIEGNGVFTGETFSNIENIINPEPLFNPLNYIKEKKEKIKRTIKTITTGKIQLPYKVQKIINKYSNKKITGIKIHRTPLSKTIMTVLNLASGNTLNDKIKNASYDKLFHLFMCIETTDGKFMIEKNEVINAKEACNLPKDTETHIITEIPNDLTVDELISNTEKKMGDNFLTYNASSNNCQNFISSILEANHIGSHTDIGFIKQDTESLFKGNPIFKKIVDSFTDIGSKFSNITGGEITNTEPIEFKKLNWGSLTKQMKAYNSVHPKKLDLYGFAKHIVKNPKDYAKKTLHRANFYLNIITGKGLFDLIKSVGTTVSKPYEVSGINPFDFGFNLGEKIIAPQLMRVIPPEKIKKTIGGKIEQKISIDNKMDAQKSKKTNSWIQHVKDYAKMQKINYRDALKDPACKLSYSKVGSGMPTSKETTLGVDYESTNLGNFKQGL